MQQPEITGISRRSFGLGTFACFAGLLPCGATAATSGDFSIPYRNPIVGSRTYEAVAWDGATGTPDYGWIKVVRARGMIVNYESLGVISEGDSKGEEIGEDYSTYGHFKIFDGEHDGVDRQMERLWPLEPGKRIEFSQGENYTARFEVLDRVNIEIPAGAFDTIRVRRTDGYNGDISTEDLYWNPVSARIVRSDYLKQDGTVTSHPVLKMRRT